MNLSSQFIRSFAVAVLALALTSCSQVSEKGGIPTDPTNKDQVSTKPEGGGILRFEPKVDILFVIDDSGSMSGYQDNLSDNVELFTDELAKNTSLNYHIGVITTSPSQDFGCDTAGHSVCGGGRLVRAKTNIPFIDNATPKGLSILKKNLRVGATGSGVEAVFDPIKLAFTAPLLSGDNKDFLRPDATLVVVILTDSKDQSTKIRTGDEIYRFLAKLKGGDARKLIVYGVVIPTGAPTSAFCSRDDGPPVEIEKLISLANGREYNICDTDYGSKLAQLGVDVALKVARIMYLSRPPILETIVVTYGSQIIPNDRDRGWVFDPVRNALIFGDKIELTSQPPGTTLSVSFTAGKF